MQNPWMIKVHLLREKELSKLPVKVRARAKQKLNQLAALENPTIIAKALKGNHSGCYRIRIGDYRLLFYLEEDTRTIVVIALAHRSKVY